MKAVAASGERGVMDLMAATHVGNTTAEFEAIVTEWIRTARHPKFNRPYTDLVYQPMLELLTYLRANGFKTYIVSGGGVEFMRPWVERVYGIPPEQVVGSRAKVKYELRGSDPVLVRLPEIDLLDDKAGKPVGIHQVIGRRPVAAFGNSDGDFEMLEWTTSAKGAVRSDRPSHRRRSRVGVRPHLAHWNSGTRPRRGAHTGLDRGRHEEGLESDLPISEVSCSRKGV
jgi:haloacid dehalogenase-like hydrolase